MPESSIGVVADVIKAAWRMTPRLKYVSGWVIGLARKMSPVFRVPFP